MYLRPTIVCHYWLQCTAMTTFCSDKSELTLSPCVSVTYACLDIIGLQIQPWLRAGSARLRAITGLYLWGFNPLHEVANPPSHTSYSVHWGCLKPPLTPLLPMLQLRSKCMHCVCVKIECRLAS